MGNHISVEAAARRASEVCSAADRPPVCTHSVRGQRLIFQSFWLGWFALIAGAVYHWVSWGLTGLRSPSDELRSEGNIQHSCAYSEGRERNAASLSGTRAAPPSAFLKMFARVQERDFPQWPWNGNATREIELAGDNRFVTGREAANPEANMSGHIAATAWQIKAGCVWRLCWANYLPVNLTSLFLEAQEKRNGAVDADTTLTDTKLQPCVFCCWKRCPAWITRSYPGCLFCSL